MIEISDASLLRLEPGDILLVRIPVNLTPEQIRDMRENFRRILGDVGHDHDVKLVFVQQGFDIGILRGWSGGEVQLWPRKDKP